MLKVKSSVLKGFEVVGNDLEVTFVSGEKYRYENVKPASIGKMLMASEKGESVGKIFRKEVLPLVSHRL